MPIEEVDEAIARVFRELDWKDARETLIKLGENSAEYLRAHIELEHTIPSPSKALNCRRQMWYKAHGAESDRDFPESWLLAAMTGVLTESIWLTVLTIADPRLVPSPVDTLDVGYGVGTPDAELRNLEGSPLVEMKRRTGWPFQYLIERGVKSEQEDAYAQAQDYMKAGKRKWCLMLFSVADHSFYQNIMRKFKRQPNKKFPFYYVEWVEFDRVYSKKVTDRQYGTVRILNDNDPPAREYGIDNKLLDPDNGEWPCHTPDRFGGCPFWKKCTERGP
jgi:hypothetical protein